jgi:hypothetical protein
VVGVGGGVLENVQDRLCGVGLADGGGDFLDRQWRAGVDAKVGQNLTL